MPAGNIGSETVNDRCTRAALAESPPDEAVVWEALVELDRRSGSMGAVDSEPVLPAASRSRSVSLAGAEGAKGGRDGDDMSSGDPPFPGPSGTLRVRTWGGLEVSMPSCDLLVPRSLMSSLYRGLMMALTPGEAARRE